MLLAAEVEQRYDLFQQLLAVLDEESNSATGMKVPRVALAGCTSVQTAKQKQPPPFQWLH
jgi:hypothetical protein